jgi:hypothetical protein
MAFPQSIEPASARRSATCRMLASVSLGGPVALGRQEPAEMAEDHNDDTVVEQVRAQKELSRAQYWEESLFQV